SKNKEIRLRPKIGEADFMTKVNRAKRFLGQKDKAIFSVIFRGRENAHVEEGFKLVDKLVSELEPVSKLEQRPAMQGRRIVDIFSPRGFGGRLGVYSRRRAREGPARAASLQALWRFYPLAVAAVMSKNPSKAKVATDDRNEK